MKIKFAVFLLTLLGIGGSAFAQGFRVDSTTVQEVSTTVVPGINNVLSIPASAQVAFCNSPANAAPCTNKATTFTSISLGTPCSTSTQIVLAGTSSCVASPDANGNFGFWVAAGTYAYTVTLPGGINLGPYTVSMGIPAGSTIAPGTINGPTAFTGNNTHSGTETFTGILQPKNLENAKYIDPSNSQGWAGSDLAAWVTSAFASCGTSTSCTVNVTLGSYATPSSSILVGDQTNLCPNYPGNQAQTLVFDMVQVTINNPIKIGCGGFLVGNQMNMFGSWITAGASLPAGAMIQAGDGVHNINAGVAFLRLNCNSVAGCQGVSFKLTNDDSYIRNMLIQNNMGDGITVDGSGGGSLTAGYMIIGENFIAAAATATNTNCIKLNKTAIPHLLRNSCVSNSAGNQTAGVYLTGGQDHDALIQALYCEKMTNCILADGNDSFTAIGIRAGNGTTNTIHLSGTAGGTVQAWGIENNANTVILNDVTGFTEASTNPPAPFGVIGCYIWSRVSNFEEYCDIQGHHWRGGGGGTAFVDLASGATLRMQNSGATETGLLGADVFGAGNIGLGTSTAHGLEFRTNGTSRVLIPSTGGLVSFAAGATDLGSTSLPFGNLWIGTAATNNFKFQPAATSGARIITLADPLSPTTVALPMTIASGTSSMTTALIATVACGTTVTTAATGVLTTDVIDADFNAAVTAANNGLLIFKAWPTAGNVNFNYCNPTAAGVTPTAMTVNWSVRRP